MQPPADYNILAHRQQVAGGIHRLHVRRPQPRGESVGILGSPCSWKG